MQSSESKPHPETLARLLLDNDDVEGAGRVCEAWRNRDPDDPRIEALEAEARTKRHAPKPLPLSQNDGERYVQHGYLPEALEIYRRLGQAGGLDENGRNRLAVLEEFLSYQLSVDADPDQISAEERVASGNLSTALLDYRKLAQSRPRDADIIRRADLLRSLVLGVPAEIRAEAAAAELAATAQMPLATKALLVLKEGNLGLAAQLFKVEGQRDGRAGTLSEALERLSELTTVAPLERSSDEDGTVRLRTEHFAAFHVRVANFSEAAEIFEGLVGEHPGKERFRRRLDDLRFVMRYLDDFDDELGDDEDDEPDTSRTETPHASQGRRKGAQPRPERALGKRSGEYELAAFRPPERPGEQAEVVLEEREKSIEIEIEEVSEATLELEAKEEQAAVAMSRGQYDEALALYREVLAADPENASAQERVAGLRRLVGEEVEERGEAIRTAVGKPYFEADDEVDDDGRATLFDGAPAALAGDADLGIDPARSSESMMPTRPLTTPAVIDDPPTSPGGALARRRKMAKTMPTPPPTVLDDGGSSVVEVPRDVVGVVERTPGPIDAGEASDVSEPLGVVARPIVVIE